MRPYIRGGVMQHDTPLDGGLWLRTLCQQCNRLASLYDDAYRDFAVSVSRHTRMTATSWLLPTTASGVPAVHIAPGRVARSVILAMVALAPSMNIIRSSFLDEMHQDGDGLCLPPGMELRIARVAHRECRISSAYSMMRVLGARQNYDVFAEICFFPFLWALCTPAQATLGPSLVDQEAWGDATDWIRYGRTVERADLRSLLKSLPLTTHPTLRNRDEWVELSSKDASYVLEGFIRM